MIIGKKTGDFYLCVQSTQGMIARFLLHLIFCHEKQERFVNGCFVRLVKSVAAWYDNKDIKQGVSFCNGFQRLQSIGGIPYETFVR